MALSFKFTPLALIAACACHTGISSDAAVLASGDAETLAKVRATLADVMGVADVELGAGDPTQQPVIAVLPPKPSPYEDRSPATPILFDIVLKGKVCYAVRRQTGEEYELEGVSCRLYAPAR